MHSAYRSHDGIECLRKDQSLKAALVSRMGKGVRGC
jgi:hypothetical protein